MAQIHVYHDPTQHDSYRSTHLPAEIWNSIISRAGTSSRISLSRVSRPLFHLTVPYIWRDVNITTVLGLLPGSSHQHPRDPEGFEIEVPSHLPEGYFERLDIYAPHIQMIGFTCAWLVPKDYSRHVISWPAIALRTADRALLPNLRAISLEGKGSFGHQLYVALDWVDALVLPSLNLVQCTFDLKLEGIDLVVKYKAQHILGQILSQSPKLEYLSLQSYNAWEVAGPSGVDHFPFWDVILQSLSYLAITSELLSSSSLVWIAKLPKLRRLQLSSPGLTPQHIVDCSLAVFPAESFGALTCLEVTTSNLGAALYLWQTSMVERLTQARIYGGRNWHIDEFLRLVSLRSPHLTRLELGLRIDSEIDPHVLASLAPLPLCELRIGMTRLASTSTLQTIGDTLPLLELLDLSLTTIDLQDLLYVYKSLPKLKRLCMNLPAELSEVRGLVETYSPPTSDPTWRIFSITLVSSAYWVRWMRPEDVNLLARLLAMACPHMKLELDTGRQVAAFCQSLQESVLACGQRLLATTGS
ncbi:hypothetical protein RhiJN_15081 [Ceratobasidium sp. AG-Ba]|nr:hypothetical protein RhiJN_15081 [Ceratobasidium sp. AG-Ba]